MKNFKHIIMIAVIGDLMSLFGIFAGEYTIISHALIFSNLGGVIIVIGSLIRGQYVHFSEILGTTVAILGCLITVSDS